jgi:pimeloyl-ACP methyl ester carboxylesterase
MPSRTTRHFVDLPAATVHYASCGKGDPVLLLHQTPRSWDEYRDVLPLLGSRRWAIAMDTAGFGDSTWHAAGDESNASIESWARVALSLLDALGISRADVVGHHTGAVIGVELARCAPGRVRSLVMSSSPYHSTATRAGQVRDKPVVDDVERRPDGSHLVELWRIRSEFYPPGAIDLLERFVRDAIRAGRFAAEGHRVVARYDMRAAVALIRCPVLLIGATADPFSYPALAKLRAVLPAAEVAEIEGGTVALPDQLPEAFASAVEGFLSADPSAAAERPGPG